MGGLVQKTFKKLVQAEKIFGTDKLTGGIFDKYLGTDILGAKEAQRKAKEEEARRNQETLNSQLNSNVIGVAGTDNVAQVEAGGTAADATATTTDLKKRRTGSISTTLGLS